MIDRARLVTRARSRKLDPVGHIPRGIGELRSGNVRLGECRHRNRAGPLYGSPTIRAERAEGASFTGSEGRATSGSRNQAPSLVQSFGIDSRN